MRNASGKRRELPAGEPVSEDMDIDAIGLLEDEYYRTVYGACSDDDTDDEGGAA